MLFPTRRVIFHFHKYIFLSPCSGIRASTDCEFINMLLCGDTNYHVSTREEVSLWRAEGSKNLRHELFSLSKKE